MRSKVCYSFTITIAACLFMVIASEQGNAQIPGPDERPDLWTRVQDTLWVLLPQPNGDTLNPNLASGSYAFSMQYDSTGLTRYLFTEPWHNGNRLKLSHWRVNREVNMQEDTLSLNSYTENFTIHAGDTVSFVRHFRWWNATTWQQDSNSFFSRDTLTYVVELVNAHDSPRYRTRLAVIDSFGVMPRSTLGKPQFFGGTDRAIFARVKYAVPTSMNGKPVFMRVRVRARGTGEYFFTRTDRMTHNYSGLLANPERQAIINYYKQGHYWTKTAPEGDEVPSTAAAVMTIQRSGTDPASITMQLAAAPELGTIAVTIYDVQGSALSTPFTGTLEQPQTITYTFPASGSYLIGITRNGQILHTEKILITK